jgi:hypothetical protein
MTLIIDQLGKAREIWDFLVRIPMDDETLYRWLSIAGLEDFEKACQQVHAHMRGNGRPPKKLNRWMKDFLYNRRTQRLKAEGSINAIQMTEGFEINEEAQ